MADPTQPCEETTMKRHSPGRKEHRILETECNNEPVLTELSIDNGAWLEMEQITTPPVIPPVVCKKIHVLLHVSLEESEHEYGLFQYCQNKEIRGELRNPEPPAGFKKSSRENISQKNQVLI